MKIADLHTIKGFRLSFIYKNEMTANSLYELDLIIASVALTTLPQWLSNLVSPVYTIKHRGHTWMTCQYISLLSEGCMISFYCICIFFWNKFHRTTDMLVYWWSQNGRLSAHAAFMLYRIIPGTPLWYL